MKKIELATAALLAVSAAQPLAAQDQTFTHRADLCVIEQTNAQLGAGLLDMILAQSGLAESDANPLDDLTILATECVNEHGTPDTSGRVTGGFAVAYAVRNEARRRLEQRGFDMAWLDAAYAAERADPASNPAKISEALRDRMVADEPQGFGAGAGAGYETEEGRMTLALVHAYAFSRVQLEQLGMQLPE